MFALLLVDYFAKRLACFHPGEPVTGENAPDVVAHLLEYFPDFLIAALGLGWVGERPVMAVRLAGEAGAGRVGVVANGDDRLDVASEKLVHVLGQVPGNIDADVGHGADGEGMNITGGFGAGALDVEHVTRDRAQNALGHVAAAGVAGACRESGQSAWFVFPLRVPVPAWLLTDRAWPSGSIAKRARRAGRQAGGRAGKSRTL